MAKASRLFAGEEMKQAAREFRLNAQAQELIHPVYNDEDELLEDYFLAGALWYRSYAEQNKINGEKLVP